MPFRKKGLHATYKSTEGLLKRIQYRMTDAFDSGTRKPILLCLLSTFK